MYSCSEMENGHQMVPVCPFCEARHYCRIHVPDIIWEYYLCIVVLKSKTDTKWCPFCKARHYCRIHVPDIIREYYLCIVVGKRKTDTKWCPFC